MVRTVGNYDLFHTLGVGSYGKVKFGVNKKTGEEVAIKILDKESILRQNMAEQIKKEIAIMKSINHKHVVSIREVFATSSKIFLVIEYVEGGELLKYLNENTLQEDEARYFFKQLVEGLQFCHTNGVCHRDLKPENLLLDNHGVLKISDFGLGTLYMGNDQGEAPERRKILHTTCGTPNYVCPEVLESRGYDGCKADVWSIGVVLYTLLSGLLPFEEETIAALFAKIKSAQYTTPSSFSPEAKDLISRILVADPDKRITLAEMSSHPWMMGSTKSPAMHPQASQPSKSKEKKNKQQQFNKSRAGHKADGAVIAAGPGKKHGHVTIDDEHKRQRECGGDENTDTSNNTKAKCEEEGDSGSNSSESRLGSHNHRACSRSRHHHQQQQQQQRRGGGDDKGVLPQPPLPPEMSEEQRYMYDKACSPGLVNALETAVSRAFSPSEEHGDGFVPAINNSIGNENNTLSLLDPNTLPAVDSDTGSGGRGQGRQQTAVESTAAAEAAEAAAAAAATATTSSVVSGNSDPQQKQQQQQQQPEEREEECKEGLSAAAAVDCTTTTTTTVGTAVAANAKPAQEQQHDGASVTVEVAHQGCAACVIS